MEALRNLQVDNLSLKSIFTLQQDAMSRIGSSMVGGNPDFEYIKQQESIICKLHVEAVKRILK